MVSAVLLRQRWAVDRGSTRQKWAMDRGSTRQRWAVDRGGTGLLEPSNHFLSLSLAYSCRVCTLNKLSVISLDDLVNNYFAKS